MNASTVNTDSSEFDEVTLVSSLVSTPGSI